MSTDGEYPDAYRGYAEPYDNGRPSSPSSLSSASLRSRVSHSSSRRSSVSSARSTRSDANGAHPTGVIPPPTHGIGHPPHHHGVTGHQHGAGHEASSHEHHPTDSSSIHAKKEHEGQPEPTTTTRRHPLLAHLALPLALLVGAGIIAGTTYALVSSVQDRIANAAVDGDLLHWKRKARDEAYDGCYLGCTSCNDPEFAYKACQLTARAVVKGINCDANRMWNWAIQDRYPDQCLTAVAGIMMGEALERLRQTIRNQLALIILTVLGGALGGFLTYKLVQRAIRSKEEKEAARARKAWSIRNPRTWKVASKQGSSSSSSRGSSKKKKLGATFLGLFGARTANAYPCAGRDPAHTQFFASPNGTVSGVVHGWFSDCRDREDCKQVCSGQTCTTDSNGKRTCKDNCKTKCTTVTTTEKFPLSYVERILPRVRACGFNVLDAPNGATVATRVANAGIERNHWVRISVSGLNVTKPTETDPMVVCLHSIGDQL